jgi:phosphoglycolate phosphatase
MVIKAVLFDKDGTLIDVNRTWVPFYKAMLKQEQGLSAEAVEAKMVLTGLDPVTNTFRAGSTLAGGTTRQLVQQWWPEASPDEHAAIVRRLDHDYGALALSYMTPLMPLGPVLHKLQSMDLVLGVATNDGEASARRHMRALNVDHYFAAIIGSDSVAIPKPSGQMLRLFAEKTGLRPDEIAMVGDNTHDLEEARNGGAGLAVGVLTGNAQRIHLHGQANVVLDSISDLAAYLREQ